MATALENLIIARDKIAQALADFDYDKPTYSIDGQSVQWDTHLQTLIDKLKSFNEQIAALDVGEIINVVKATG